MLVIGLTGGIGSGKSAVAARFAQFGVPVLDADELAREVVQPGQPALHEIVQAFGAEVLQADGQLDRARLRRLVFGNPEQRRRLEAITHPRIRAAMRARLAQLVAPYCVVVIPLLLETGQTDLVDRILVVDASPELQLQRAQARDGLPPQDIQAIIAAQVARPERLAAADDLITNDGTLADLQAQVDALHPRYLGLARERVDCQAERPPGE
ncbi:dephospho-CoA kinase [Ectothiorhodospiraceae bacterium 2226]|nr:dephospho-CoA kinase [Ectothiorhodospiraceae bacterium 2226]